MNIDDKQIAEALDRIARTPDGLALYLYCQKSLCAVPVDPTGDALLAHHGRRRFAAELIAQMRTGVMESNGGRDPSERPFVFGGTEPVRTGARASPRAFLQSVGPDAKHDERRARAADDTGS